MQYWMDEARQHLEQYPGEALSEWVQPVAVYMKGRSFDDNGVSLTLPDVMNGLMLQESDLEWIDRAELVNQAVLNEAIEIRTNYDEAMLEMGYDLSADSSVTSPVPCEDFALQIREFNERHPFVIEYETIMTAQKLLDRNGEFTKTLWPEGEAEAEFVNNPVHEAAFDSEIQQVMMQDQIESDDHLTILKRLLDKGESGDLINQVLQDEIIEVELGEAEPKELVEMMGEVSEHGNVRITGATWEKFTKLDIPEEIMEPLGPVGKQYADAVRADQRLERGEDVTSNQTRVDAALEHGVDFSRDVDFGRLMERERRLEIEREAATAQLDHSIGELIEADYIEKPLVDKESVFGEFLTKHGRNMDGSPVEPQADTNEAAVDLSSQHDDEYSL